VRGTKDVGQAAQKLVECRFAQLRSADPVNLISL
jgi:hypothetical protein